MVKSTKNSEPETYDKLSTDFQQKEFLDLVSPLNIKPGFKCIDIGCGTGSNTACLAKMVGKDGHVIGIDPDEKRIEFASEKYKDVKNLDFVVGKSIDIPLCNKGYEFIVSTHAMHWVSPAETKDTYRKAFKTIKPGGIIAIIETAGLTRLQKAYFPNCSDKMRQKLLSAVHYTSLEENREMLTDIGFEIIEIEESVLTCHFESINTYLKLTMDGVEDGKEIYERNMDTFDALKNDDGSLTEEITITRIVATKSVSYNNINQQGLLLNYQ